MIDDQAEFDLDAAKVDREREARIEAERAELRSALDANQLDTLVRKVAWVLNYYPEARDSDITLMLHFWDTFESTDTAYGINRNDLYKLTRLTSLARARAKIQNTYRLFEASPSVRRQRGQLAGEERKRRVEEPHRSPAYVVYADESGKHGEFLIFASVWVLHPAEILRLTNAIQSWRKFNSFEQEFHFTDINRGNISKYVEFADFIHSESAVLTFRAITAKKLGHKNTQDALEKMLYHLLFRGVEHEDNTARASLPRTLIVNKDEDSPGPDAMMLREAAHRLELASSAHFGGKLSLGEFKAVSSKGNVLIQIADLVAGSLNRIKNERDSGGPKDQFARYLLRNIGLAEGPETTDTAVDIAVLISI